MFPGTQSIVICGMYETSVRFVEPDITNDKKIFVNMSCGAEFANILFVYKASWIITIGIHFFMSRSILP